MKTIIVLFVIIAILVTGCVGTSNGAGENQKTSFKVLKTDSSIFNTKITVIHDDEYNVTCWEVYDESHGGTGVSCIPDTQLRATE